MNEKATVELTPEEWQTIRVALLHRADELTERESKHAEKYRLAYEALLDQTAEATFHLCNH